jgi:hypothetical protein
MMRPFFMSYVRGEDRDQGALLPSALEDYVTADGPVRVIDAFVAGLDVSRLGFARRLSGPAAPLCCSAGISGCSGRALWRSMARSSGPRRAQADHGPAGSPRRRRVSTGGLPSIWPAWKSDAREPDGRRTRRLGRWRRAASNSTAWRRRSRPKSAAPGLKERPTPARWASARGRRPSYNVQTAVDADTGLIVHHAVTNEPNDTRQLHPMPKAAKEALGFERLTVVADAGYSNGAAAAACEVDGITACAPANRGTNSQGDGALFDRSAFAYQPEADVYVCPTGRALAPSSRCGATPSSSAPRAIAQTAR